MSKTESTTEALGTQAQQQAPGMIVRPGLVKGFLPTATKPPDRLFYILYLQDDLVWECDGYKKPAENGTQPGWMIVLTCPICRNHLTLDTTKKKVEITAEGIQSESFRCSHPAEFGGVCPFEIVLARPSRKSERQVQVQSRWYKIDAVARNAR
jgi:uncharacterized protein YbaR (Trm112 family)